MGIKSEMLKYAAAAAVESSTIQNIFHCFSFFLFIVFVSFSVVCRDSKWLHVRNGFSQRPRKTRTHKYNFMKSCDGITAKNKSKVQNEKRGKKQQTTNNEVHTQAPKCLQLFGNHILRKCVRLCAVHAGKRITFFFLLLFAFESNIVNFPRKKERTET